MNLYEYLKNEFMLSGCIQIDDAENSNPSHFGDFRYNSYYGRVLEDIEELKKEDINKAWFFPAFMMFGDYDSSCHVERSNKRVFLEEFGHVDGVKEIYGGHGSEAVIIRLDTDIKEFIDVLEALEYYPAINDEDCFYLKMEMIEESWNEVYGRSDMEDELEKRGINASADKVRKIGNRDGGLEFIESGGIVYHDIDKMIYNYLKETSKEAAK